MLSAYDYFTNSFTISILQDFRESCTPVFTLASLENVFTNEWFNYKTVRYLHTGCLDKGKDICSLGYGGASVVDSKLPVPSRARSTNS